MKVKERDPKGKERIVGRKPAYVREHCHWKDDNGICLEPSGPHQGRQCAVFLILEGRSGGGKQPRPCNPLIIHSRTS